MLSWGWARLRTTLLLGCLLLWPLAGPCFGPPSAINTNAATDIGDDLKPSVAQTAPGCWMAVWQTTASLGVAAPTGGDWDIAFATSQTNGALWSAPAPVNANSGSDDAADESPQLRVSSAGTAIVVWQSTPPGLLSDILFARRIGNGAWTVPARVDSGTADDGRQDLLPQLATDNAGNWVAVWSSALPGANTKVYCSRSTDDGVTWSAPTPLDPSGPGTPGRDFDPVIESNGEGTWIAVWAIQGLGICPHYCDYSDLYMSRSLDAGLTWSVPAILHDSGGCFSTNTGVRCHGDSRPQVVYAGGGNWQVIWEWENTYRSTATYWSYQADIAFKRIKDNGTTWTAAIVLTKPTPYTYRGLYCRAPRLASDGPGSWLAVFLVSGLPRDSEHHVDE